MLYVTHDQVEAMTLADTLWVMNGGLVEQKGAPLEVYGRPRTKFVATFLGSPQMNLVEGKLVSRGAGSAGDWVAEGGGLVVPVDEARFQTNLVAGRPVTIGVRPHDFAPAREGAPQAGKLNVEIVEALGFEAFAHGWFTASGPRANSTGPFLASERVRARAVLTGAFLASERVGPRIIVRLEAQDARSGSGRARALPLVVAPSHVHLFDPTTGRSLAAT